MNKEHQSRYYQTHQYTVYGMIVDSHVEDHADFDEREKAALIALLDANNLPHIITQSHIVCSEDTVHDPAAVMHYNIKVLFPAIKEQMPRLTTIYMSTDGAPTQYMHADIYYFISRCKVQHGLRLSWVIGCAAHGKDLSDSECGGAKHCVDFVNLQHSASDDEHGTRISTVPEVVRHLEQPYPVGYSTTKKTRSPRRRAPASTAASFTTCRFGLSAGGSRTATTSTAPSRCTSSWTSARRARSSYDDGRATSAPAAWRWTRRRS